MLLLQSKFPHREWYLILSNLNILFSLEQRHLIKHLQSRVLHLWIWFFNCHGQNDNGIFNLSLQTGALLQGWTVDKYDLRSKQHCTTATVQFPKWHRMCHCAKCLSWTVLRLWKKLYVLFIPHFNTVFSAVMVSRFCVCL